MKGFVSFSFSSLEIVKMIEEIMLWMVLEDEEEQNKESRTEEEISF